MWYIWRDNWVLVGIRVVVEEVFEDDGHWRYIGYRWMGVMVRASLMFGVMNF